jgi:DNA-binding CsgD family transcriptional regulator
MEISMTTPIVHIVSSSKQNNYLIASAVIVLEPSCRIIEHGTYSEYLNNVDRNSEAVWQIVATDMPVEVATDDNISFMIPVVYFTHTRESNLLNGSDAQSPPFPVYVGEIKPYLQEAIAAATLFKKLSLRMQRMSQLNDREKSVLSMAAQGVPNKTIAKRLNVSIKTIEQCRRNAYSKLGITSAAEVGSLLTFNKVFTFFDRAIAMPQFMHSTT